MEPSNTNLIFIVGVGRSGISLLQSMLHAHEQICFLPETAFIRRFLASGLLARQLNKGGRDALFRTLSQDERVKRLGLPDALLRDTLPQDASELPKIYGQLMAAFAQQRGSYRFLGDKDPRNSEYLPWIHRHFPQAHVIHIYRDPRDVLASKKKAAWCKKHGLFYHIFVNRVQFHLASSSGAALFGKRYHQLAYEQLIAEPESCLRQLCDLLALPYDPAMINFGEAGKDLVAADEMAWKKVTLGPLLNESSGQWAQSLSSSEIAACERLCSGVMRAGGYPNAAPIVHRLLMSLLILPFQVAQSLYGVYRRWAIH